jgi:hypothetical protein
MLVSFLFVASYLRNRASSESASEIKLVRHPKRPMAHVPSLVRSCEGGGGDEEVV